LRWPRSGSRAPTRPSAATVPGRAIQRDRGGDLLHNPLLCLGLP
jgi:hypothetical protein